MSKAGTQGFILEVLRELFPKILHPRLPRDSSNCTTFRNLFNIKKREKITWSLQSIGFHSNFILHKTVKIFVLQAAACGWYKKCSLSTWANCWSAQRYLHPVLRTQEQFWLFCLELGISSVMDFSPYCSPWVFIIKGILWPRWQKLVAIEMCNCLQVQYWIVLPSWD